MKRNYSFLLFVLVFTMIMPGCKVAYQFTYTTYLQGSPDESLQYSDSLISVTFNPLPNGVIFDIHNLKKNNLFLIWDKSYFIEPSGSSSKALNTDLLQTEKAVRDKENYESVIPLGAHFKRFTCSATNLSVFSAYTTFELYNEISNSMLSNTSYSTFYTKASYWPFESEVNWDAREFLPIQDNLQAKNIKEFITANNELGMGFTVKNQNREYEYHFKFPIKKVIIARKTPDEAIFSYLLELKKENGFNVPPNPTP